jgi:hypothetical protein
LDCTYVSGLPTQSEGSASSDETWLSTALGGLQLCWTASPADERQPALPTRFIGLQLVWMLYPAIVCLILNALYFYDVLGIRPRRSTGQTESMHRRWFLTLSVSDIRPCWELDAIVFL